MLEVSPIEGELSSITVDCFPIRPKDLLFKKKMLYAATRTEGIICYDANNNHDRSIFLNQSSGLPTNDTTSIDFDREGNAYIGTHCYGLWCGKFIEKSRRLHITK